MSEVNPLIDLKKYVDFKGIAQEICRLYPESQCTFVKDVNNTIVYGTILSDAFYSNLMNEIVKVRIVQNERT